MTEPKLASLGAQPTPPFLPTDVETLLALPETAQAKFWKVLEHCLDEELPPDIDGRIDEFAAQHDTQGKEVAEAIRGCRFLLLEAARRDCPEHVLAADLATLGGDRADRLREILLHNFEQARERVRFGLIRKALLDHGPLLEGARIRLDRMTASQDGLLGAPVAILTLSLRDGDARSRVTMQAELGTLATLRDTLSAVLQPPEGNVDGEPDPL